MTAKIITKTANTTSTATFTLPNGRCQTRTGYRQVALVPFSLALRPVKYRIYSGYQDGRVTVQLCAPGDLVARVDWGSRGEWYGIWRFKPDGDIKKLSPMEEGQLWPHIRQAHPWLDAWLAPHPRGASWLPEEVAPEALDLSRLRKERAIKDFCQRVGLPFKVRESLWREAKISPRDGLELSFKKARKLGDPAKVERYARQWSGSAVGIDCDEHYWACAPNSGKEAVNVSPPEPTDGEWGSNYAHEPSGYFSGKPGLVNVPEWATHVVKIMWGAYTRDHHSYGVAVEVYSL